LNKKTRKYVGVLLITAMLCLSVGYYIFFAVNTTSSSDGTYFYIRKNDTYQTVRQGLISNKIVKNVQTFDLAAQKMNLSNTFKPGRYKIDGRFTNVQLIRKIRNGNWDKVVIKIDLEMTRTQIMDHLVSSLEPNKEDLIEVLNDKWVKENGFTDENKWCIFLADHYHFNWAVSADDIIQRFLYEYNTFWSAERKAKAKSVGLNTKEACILGSIVDGEAVHVSEMSTIAGLYLNRLRKGMLLQADPTVLYVVGREGRRRVLYRDLKAKNPYNTYLNKGLPPGPIFSPDKRAILASINPKKHNYIFMCAKPDRSYYHNFTASAAEHRKNARAYRKSLNARGVKR
jgi:UPF0755 protein